MCLSAVNFSRNTRASVEFLQVPAEPGVSLFRAHTLMADRKVKHTPRGGRKCFYAAVSHSQLLQAWLSLSHDQTNRPDKVQKLYTKRGQLTRMRKRNRAFLAESQRFSLTRFTELETIQLLSESWDCTRREFLREILYNNIAIIAIQHSNIYFVDTFGDFSHTVE